MKLHLAVEQFITLKQSLGFRFHGERVILKAFCKAMGKVTLGQVKPQAVRTYLDGKGPVTRHRRRKWEVLRSFYCFAVARGLAHRSPLPTHAPKVATPFRAHSYTQQELRRLLQAITPKVTGGLSPQTVRTLLLLLYGRACALAKR